MDRASGWVMAAAMILSIGSSHQASVSSSQHPKSVLTLGMTATSDDQDHPNGILTSPLLSVNGQPIAVSFRSSANVANPTGTVSGLHGRPSSIRLTSDRIFNSRSQQTLTEARARALAAVRSRNNILTSNAIPMSRRGSDPYLPIWQVLSQPFPTLPLSVRVRLALQTAARARAATASPASDSTVGGSDDSSVGVGAGGGAVGQAQAEAAAAGSAQTSGQPTGSSQTSAQSSSGQTSTAVHSAVSGLAPASSQIPGGQVNLISLRAPEGRAESAVDLNKILLDVHRRTQTVANPAFNVLRSAEWVVNLLRQRQALAHAHALAQAQVQALAHAQAQAQALAVAQAEGSDSQSNASTERDENASGQHPLTAQPGPAMDDMNDVNDDGSPSKTDNGGSATGSGASKTDDKTDDTNDDTASTSKVTDSPSDVASPTTGNTGQITDDAGSTTDDAGSTTDDAGQTTDDSGPTTDDADNDGSSVPSPLATTAGPTSPADDMPTSTEDTAEQGLGKNPDGLTVNIPDDFKLSGGIPVLIPTPGGVKVTILNRANKLIDDLASGYSLDLNTNKVIVNSLDPTTSRAKQHGSGSLYTVKVDPMLNVLTLSPVHLNLNYLLPSVSKPLLGDTRSASDIGPKIGAGFLSLFDSNPASESGATTKIDSKPTATTFETGSSAQTGSSTESGSSSSIQTGSLTQTGLSPTQTSSPVITAATDSKTQTGPSTNTGLSPTQTSSSSTTASDSQTQTGTRATPVETQTPSPTQTISDMTTAILPWFTIPDSLETESQEAEEFETEETTPAATSSIGTTNPITDNPLFKSLTTTSNLTPRSISAADFVNILNVLFGRSNAFSGAPSKDILEDFEEVVRDLTPDGSSAGSTMDA